MKFCKAHGLGNDFILIALDEAADGSFWQKIAPRLCDRHTGFGADGILLIYPSQNADFFMGVINSDGSIAQMCGNGIRCAALFAYENGIVDTISMTVDTLAGIKSIELTPVSPQKTGLVRVDMGVPDFNVSSFDANVGQDEILRFPITIENRRFEISTVFTGVPHTVVFGDDFTSEEVIHWGPLIEKYPIFKKGTNVDFVKVRAENELEMYTWERGAGFTLACGTGTCAAAAVYQRLNGLTGPCKVRLPLGDMTIETVDGHLYMQGPAVIVGYGMFDPYDFIQE